MIIEENDFRLISIDDCSLRFDLELLHVVNKGKSNERTEFKNSGYGFSLCNAIEKIIAYRINKKQEVYTLQAFMQQFKKEKEEIKELCQVTKN